jgi:hypothetical protein
MTPRVYPTKTSQNILLFYYSKELDWLKKPLQTELIFFYYSYLVIWQYLIVGITFLVCVKIQNTSIILEHFVLLSTHQCQHKFKKIYFIALIKVFDHMFLKPTRPLNKLLITVNT